MTGCKKFDLCASPGSPVARSDLNVSLLWWEQRNYQRVISKLTETEGRENEIKISQETERPPCSHNVCAKTQIGNLLSFALTQLQRNLCHTPYWVLSLGLLDDQWTLTEQENNFILNWGVYPLLHKEVLPNYKLSRAVGELVDRKKVSRRNATTTAKTKLLKFCASVNLVRLLTTW